MLGTCPKQHHAVAALSAGAGIGTLGGLIGLGGAEFRLPLLIGLFGFGALEAVMLNKALSLVVVATALLSALLLYRLVCCLSIGTSLLPYSQEAWQVHGVAQDGLHKCGRRHSIKS